MGDSVRLFCSLRFASLLLRGGRELNSFEPIHSVLFCFARFASSGIALPKAMQAMRESPRRSAPKIKSDSAALAEPGKALLLVSLCVVANLGSNPSGAESAVA